MWSMEFSRESGIAERIDLDCFALINELIWQRDNREKRICSDEQELIQRADSYLHSHITEYVDFNELASSLGMSKSTFFRRWKEYFNDTPANYFMNLKLEESARLLAQKRYKIFEISQLLNFSTSTYFCAVFRKKYGKTPLEYSKSL